MKSLLHLTYADRAPSGEWKVYSPIQSGNLLASIQYHYSEIDTAIEGAIEERENLRKVAFSEKIKFLKKLWSVLDSNKKSILEKATFEQCRAPQDLEQEWSQLSRFFSALLTVAPQDEKIHEPRGVTAVLGSSVWPIFYSIQFFSLNYLAGNPVILKPSEKTSMTLLRLFKIIRNEIPELKSVQVLLGEKEMGRRLACHEQISTVIFQGSFEVGMRVKQDTLSQLSKKVLLFLGAKNPSVIFNDAPAAALETVMKDAFQGAGQDCQSTSVLLVQNGILNQFLPKLHGQAKEFKIGSEEGYFMGPMFDSATVDRYLKFIGISEREGAEILMRGKPFEKNGKGSFVTPTLAYFEKQTPEQIRKSVSLQTEILGPHLSVIGFQDEAELLSLANAFSYGRSISLWSEDGARLEPLARELQYGQILFNQSLLSSDPWKSFQFRKRSGSNAVLGEDLLFKLLYLKTVQK